MMIEQAPKTPGDEHLIQGPSGLTWGGHNLGSLAKHYGTPLYVVNKQRLKASYQGMLDAFGAYNVDVNIFFSFKTNPVPDVLKALIEIGAGAEVISLHELRLARDLGVPGHLIIVNGTIKTRELLEESIACDVGLINVESMSELQLLQDIAKHMGKRAQVGLRVNPALRRRWFDFTVSSGTSSSPMGFLPGSEDWRMALDLLESSTTLDLRGLHCHIGSGIRTVTPYRKALETVISLWVDLYRRGFRPTVLDLGGGFNVPSLKSLSLWEAACLFGWGSPPSPPTKGNTNLMRDVAGLCKQQLQTLQQKENIPVPTIYVEPGRALSATAQILLLRVQKLIERERRPTFAFCDGGAMSLSPLLLSEYHTVLATNNKKETGCTQPYNILGNMPTSLDMVATQRVLPTLSTGDVLAILDVGAYFTSLGNNFAGPRPPIVMLEADTVRLIRRRETYRDLFTRDLQFALANDSEKPGGVES